LSRQRLVQRDLPGRYFEIQLWDGGLYKSISTDRLSSGNRPAQQQGANPIANSHPAGSSSR
jgi:hypothetical protein